MASLTQSNHPLDADTNRTIFIVGAAAIGCVILMYLLERIT